MSKFPLRGLLISLCVVGIFIFFAARNNPSSRLERRPLSEFLYQVDHGLVTGIYIKNDRMEVSVRDGLSPYYTVLPSELSLAEINSLLSGISVEKAPIGFNWAALWITLLPVLVLVGFLWYVLRSSRNTNNDSALQFGKSKARAFQEEHSKVLLQDVAGCEEAKADVAEVIEFLKKPEHFHALGARMPHGLLMLGPPGSGKTHLAKAIAGEARVPFFSISGSDFVEMFVGVGAARVRDLFDIAKKHSPCIVFIDEIDAVGRRRGAQVSGGNDEREQTLNALLVEMDGFENRHDLIVIAATNRPDVLDPALLRPGRFDRQVVVDAPDIKGREAILRIHAKGKPFAADVDFKNVAKRSPGFVGADLANLLNEAALLAARAKHSEIQQGDIDEAADRVVMGPARRSRVISDEEKAITAYHEAGHALAAHKLRYADPVHKITIVPRGRTGGYVMHFPEQDRNYKSKNMLLDDIAVALAGRAAEEIIFGDVTTGAQSDFQQATSLAYRMVTMWGMSDKVGKVALSSSQDTYLGSNLKQANYSPQMAQWIDEEVKAIIDEQYRRVRTLLQEEQVCFERLGKALIERETLNAEEFIKLVEGTTEPEAYRSYRAPPPLVERGEDEDVNSTPEILDSLALTKLIPLSPAAE